VTRHCHPADGVVLAVAHAASTYAYFVDPSRPPIPGTNGARGYKDYRFHARAFVKASVFSLAIIAPAGILIALTPSR
jgi:hypothetical protein